MSQKQPDGGGSGGSKKRSKVDEEMERLLTQLLLRRGSALQDRAEDEGVLAFCRQPVVRERLNERFLHNTLRGVFANNKRVTEAAMWEQRTAQREREEREAAAAAAAAAATARTGPHQRRRDEQGKRHTDQLPCDGGHEDCRARRRATQQEGSADGDRGRSRATASRSVSPGPGGRDEQRSRRSRSPSKQRRSHSPGPPAHGGRGRSPHRAHRMERAGARHHSPSSPAGSGRSVGSDRWQPSTSDDGGVEGGEQAEEAHGQHVRRNDSAGDVRVGHRNGDGGPGLTTEAQHQRNGRPRAHSPAPSSSSSGSLGGGSSSGSGRSGGNHRAAAAATGSADERGRSTDVASDDSQGDGGDGGDGGAWIMGDDELEELLGRHSARGRGGVGSLVDAAGPYLPPGAPSSALEGVPRGPAMPPWLAAARASEPEAPSSAAVRQVLAHNKKLAKLLRQLAKRKLEEEEDEGGGSSSDGGDDEGSRRRRKRRRKSSSRDRRNKKKGRSKDKSWRKDKHRSSRKKDKGKERK